MRKLKKLLSIESDMILAMLFVIAVLLAVLGIFL